VPPDEYASSEAFFFSMHIEFGIEADFPAGHGVPMKLKKVCDQ